MFDHMVGKIAATALAGATRDEIVDHVSDQWRGAPPHRQYIAEALDRRLEQQQSTNGHRNEGAPAPRRGDPDELIKGRADQLRGHLHNATDVSGLPSPVPLVAGLIYRPSLFVIYGPPKHGKTFVALDLTLALATGQPFADRVTKPARTLYVAAEGVGGLGERIDAWAIHHAGPQVMPAAIEDAKFLTTRVNLADWADVQALAVLALEHRAEVVIFDTLARCSAGLDENSAKDMGKLIETVDWLRAHTGATVGLIHHTGKDTGRGARGSNSLLGAVDTELEVTRDGSRITVRNTAQKDAEETGPIGFTLKPVGASVVAVPASAIDAVPESVWHVLDTLCQIAPAGEEVASTAWKDSCDVSARTFHRARGWLLMSGRVDNVGTAQKPRYRVALKDPE